MSCGISWNWPSFQGNGTIIVLPWTNGAGAAMADEARGQWPIPRNCRIQNLRGTIRLVAGVSWVFTIRQNGGDTPLSITFSGTSLAASDVAHSVLFSPGDLISLKASTGGSGWDATISADFRPA